MAVWLIFFFNFGNVVFFSFSLSMIGFLQHSWVELKHWNGIMTLLSQTHRHNLMDSTKFNTIIPKIKPNIQTLSLPGKIDALSNLRFPTLARITAHSRETRVSRYQNATQLFHSYQRFPFPVSRCVLRSAAAFSSSTRVRRQAVSGTAHCPNAIGVFTSPLSTWLALSTSSA